MMPRVVISIALVSLITVHAQSRDGWRAVPSPTTDSIRSVQVAGDTLWLLGEDRLFRGTLEGAWSPAISLEGARWTTMIAAGPDLVYGVTETDQNIQSWRAGQLSTIGSLDRCASFDAVLATFASTFAAGCPYYSGLAFWRTGDNAVVEDGPLMAPRALRTIGDGDVLVLDLDGLKRARRKDESAIVLRDHPAGEPHELLWATVEHIVTGTRDGEFAHATWNAATNTVGPWTMSRAPRQVALAEVWGRGPQDLYAVGGDGVVLHFDGRAWTPMSTPTRVRLNVVSGTADAVWAAGAEGVVLRLDTRR